jgi:hypothetical protein
MVLTRLIEKTPPLGISVSLYFKNLDESFLAGTIG